MHVNKQYHTQTHTRRCDQDFNGHALYAMSTEIWIQSKCLDRIAYMLNTANGAPGFGRWRLTLANKDNNISIFLDATKPLRIIITNDMFMKVSAVESDFQGHKKGDKQARTHLHNISPQNQMAGQNTYTRDYWSSRTPSGIKVGWKVIGVNGKPMESLAMLEQTLDAIRATHISMPSKYTFDTTTIPDPAATTLTIEASRNTAPSASASTTANIDDITSTNTNVNTDRDPEAGTTDSDSSESSRVTVEFDLAQPLSMAIHTTADGQTRVSKVSSELTSHCMN